MTRWVAIIAALIMLSVLLVIALAQKPVKRSPQLRTRVLQQIPFPTTASLEDVVVSPKGNHIAYIDRKKSENAIVIDGKAATVKRTIRSPWHSDPHYTPGIFFSPNEERLAYAEMEDPITVDRTKSRLYPVWTGRSRMVIDRVAGAWFDELDIPVFSPDSKRYLYVAMHDDKWCVVIDGKQGKYYDELGCNEQRAKIDEATRINPLIHIAPAFSADSRHVAYAARTSDKWVVVLDGQEGTPYEMVTGVTFSPDGRHLAYSAYRNHKAYLVYDKQEGPAYDVVWPPVFSPNSQRIAFTAAKANTYFVNIDGRAGKPYAFVVNWSILFSPDSRRLAFVASLSRNDMAHLICDGTEGPPYTMIWQNMFSPDSQRLAYAVENDLVIDGKQITGARHPVFSPDSARVAYRVNNRYLAGVSNDGQPAIIIAGVTPINLCFSPDGKHLLCIYTGQNSADKFITIDGHAGNHYKWIPFIETDDRYRTKQYLFFDAPDRFHFFAVKEGTIKRVEVTIPPVLPPIDASSDIVNGRTPVNGAGLTIVLDDTANAHASAPLVHRKVVHAIDLLRLVERLWGAGATAITVNGQRIGLATNIMRQGAEIQVDGIAVTAPYTISAIAPANAYPVINHQEGTLDQLRQMKIKVTLTPQASLHLPAIMATATAAKPSLPTLPQCVVEARGSSGSSAQPAVALPIAGAPYHGLKLSLGCAKSYRAGQPVLIKVSEKNVGNEVVRYVYAGFPINYHLYLTDAQGKQVEKTSRTLDLEDYEDHPNNHSVERSMNIAIELKPGEEYVRTYDLREYFIRIPAGNYTLQVRRTAREFIGIKRGAGDRGVLSLPCRFTINH